MSHAQTPSMPAESGDEWMEEIEPSLSWEGVPDVDFTPPSATDTQCSKVVRFLRDARRLVTQTSSKRLSLAQTMMKERSDYFMPLRESSSSRSLVNLKMDYARAKTASGLFSLLLYRGISYNTEAFARAPNDMHPVSSVPIFSYSDS